MRIGIISGSARQKSQTGRICRLLQDRLAQKHGHSQTKLFDLAQIHLPLWDEDRLEEGHPIGIIWPDISTSLASCDGFIIASPEWAGMATPHLKNFLLHCDKGELAHKPALLVSVSAGTGGAYPVAELRMSGYKNSYIWWLPEHLILRSVAGLFHDSRDKLNQSLLERIDHLLTLLLQCTKALKPVRKTCQNLEAHPFGM